jgi:hypothetical protein
MAGENLYAEEKLYEAVHCLVTGPGPLRERLAAAAIYLIRLTAKNFPDRATAKVFEGIREDLTIFEAGPGDDGAIDATTKRLTDYDADRIANRIFELYEKIKDMNRD